MASRGLSAKRVRRIFRLIEETGRPSKRPDAIVLRNGTEPHVDLSFFYVTAVPSGIFEGSMAVLLPDGACHVFTSRLEEESARKAKTGFRVHVPKKADEARARLRELVGDEARIGINGPELTYTDYRRLRKTFKGGSFVDVAEAIEEARIVKDDEEIAAIRRAARISSDVAGVIPGLLRTGVKEFEVAAEIDYRSQKAGGSGPSFSTIAAFGPNAAEPHYTAGGAKLRKGQFALFDYGTRYRRYCSDITRTFFHGTPTHKDKAMHETVLRAQEAAFDALGPGVAGSDVHQAAEDVIDATAFKGTFMHGLGHGLGLAVHDGGSLSPASQTVLEPGMVVTVEPGVYLNGYGGVRIEDDVLITRTGHRKLTNAPRELIASTGA
jgi:Xaa-Pro dipeptidase